MIENTWQLQIPAEAIIFDCDSTLSAIEGIDELAIHKGVYEKVQQLTTKAMEKTGINPDIYQERLALVKPTLKEVIALGTQYILHQVLNIKEVIKIFKRLNKTIYIVSAGLHPSIIPLADDLMIPRENVFAVEIDFDSQGKYIDFDRNSPLIHNDGKRVIVSKIKQSHSTIIYIGDGLNDLSVMDLTNRFIGYGGVKYREIIAKHCQFYINTPSTAALLPLTLIRQEYQLLTPFEIKLFQKGLEDIEQNRVATR